VRLDATAEEVCDRVCGANIRGSGQSHESVIIFGQVRAALDEDANDFLAEHFGCEIVALGEVCAGVCGVLRCAGH